MTEPDQPIPQRATTNESLTDDTAIPALGPHTPGRWLVTAKTSHHIWNLQPGRWTYTRLPGPNASPMAFDGEEMVISTVGAWPAVNQQSLLFYDDPSDDLVEQWRISSRIQTIRALPD